MTHPITPPPELRSQWFNETPRADIYDYIIEKAAQWGADQELKACCEWLFTEDYDVAPVRLRAARRPKPPSLKQQALDLLKTDLEPGQEVASITLPAKSIDTIRRALEALPE
jgi:hypothetical protein